MHKILLLLSVATLLLTGCNKTKEAPTESGKAISVVTEEAKLATIDNELSVNGDIEGKTTVKLGFMVAGKIAHIVPEEGQTVRKGQQVANLETENYSIAKDMADIQVNSTQDEYDRLKQMHDKNSISESDFQKVNYALQGAKAQQRLQQKNLSDTKLVSPISGILLKRLSEPGEIVAQGMPIMVISDISTVNVNAYIPENQLHNIRIGQEAKVYISAIADTVKGKVTEVGGVADPSTRAFTVKIAVTNPGMKIRPGMIAEVCLFPKNDQSLLTIPATALMHTPDGQTYIYIVDKSKNKAYKRNVSVGVMSGDRIEITSGLQAGETYVTGGQQKLVNGSSVKM